MIHLTAVEKKASFPQRQEFPFSVPVIAGLESVRFETPVTFLVGENGSGKSTFLEGLATAVRLPTVGAEEAGRDPSLAAVRQLGRHLRLRWTKRTGRGFYLRAEDFFGFARRMAQMQAELETELARAREEAETARAAIEQAVETVKAEAEAAMEVRSHQEAAVRSSQVGTLH